MYEIGPSTKNVSQINSGWTEKDLNTKANLMKIMKNGNIQSNIAKYGLDSEEDLYIATKIAIDNYIYNHSPEDVKDYYRFKSEIPKEISDRMQKIIEGASKILAEDTQETSGFSREVTVIESQAFQEDSINSNYYSIKYEVMHEGNDFLGYDVAVSVKGIEDYLITNEEDEENKIEFTSDENIFKIMIPNKYKDLEFEIEMQVIGKFREEKIYRAIEYLGEGNTPEDTPNEYVIYEDGVYRKNAESITFTHEKADEGETGGNTEGEQGKPDDGKQDEEEKDKKPNLEEVEKQEDEKEPNKEEIKKEEDKIEEDIEVKETVTANVSKPLETNNQKKLPRTRKRPFFYQIVFNRFNYVFNSD